MRLVVLASTMATTLLLIAVGGAPAHAEVPGRYVAATTGHLAPRSADKVDVDCAAGDSPTGGGYHFGSDPGIVLNGTEPGSNVDWFTIISNRTSSTQPITSYVVCADMDTRQVPSASTPVLPGGQGSATAVCPSGTRLTGGGMFTGPEFVVDTSRPLGNGWYIHAYRSNSPNQSPALITALAVCATWFTPIAVVSSSFTVRAGQGWDTVATCPPDKTNLGGGWSFALTTGLLIDISRPSTFSQGWHIHALNNTAATRTVTSWATCA